MAGKLLKSTTTDKQVELHGETVAGRSDDCDLVLSEGHPSRRHAQLTVKEDGVWLEDLGSTNGTFLNGRLLEGSVKLNTGDRVRFDLEEFELVDPEATTQVHGPDPNATVLRTEPPPATPQGDDRTTQEAAPAQKAEAAERQKTPEQPEKPNHRNAPEPPVAPPQATPRGTGREVEAGGAGRRPGAWADPDQAKQSGTVLFDEKQLEALLSEEKPAAEPLADADAPTLVVTAGEQSGATLTLKAGQQANVWDIGSDTERDIVFDEAGVSGFHAKIVNEGARWKIIDQMSSNGTLVNEKRGTISFLSSGDRIRFGPVECVFQLPKGAQGKPASGAGKSTSGSATRQAPSRIWIIAAAVAVTAVVLGYFLFV